MTHLANAPDAIAKMVSAEIGATPGRARGYCDVMGMVTRLEGVPLTREDLMVASTIGAALRRIDDVFDTGSIALARQTGAVIRNAIIRPDSELAGVQDPRIIQAITIAHETFNPSAMDALRVLIDAELDSVAQREVATPDDAIESISRRKATFFLFSAQANPSMSPERANCHKELAYLLQLLNDYKDRHEDQAHGIHTMITRAPSNSAAILFIIRQYQKVRALFAREYKRSETIELFAYVDHLMKTAGLIVRPLPLP